MIGNNQINKNSLNVQKNLNLQENEKKNESNPAKTEVKFLNVLILIPSQIKNNEKTDLNFLNLKYIVEEFYINSENLQNLVYFARYLPPNQIFNLINIFNWNMNLIYQE